jgi:hypothetical protein
MYSPYNKELKGANFWNIKNLLNIMAIIIKFQFFLNMTI